MQLFPLWFSVLWILLPWSPDLLSTGLEVDLSRPLGRSWGSPCWFCLPGITILCCLKSKILKTVASCILSNLLVVSGERENPFPELDPVPRCYSVLVGGRSVYCLSLGNLLRASGALGYAKASCLSSGQEKGVLLEETGRASDRTTRKLSHSRRDRSLCFSVKSLALIIVLNLLFYIPLSVKVFFSSISKQDLSA